MNKSQKEILKSLGLYKNLDSEEVALPYIKKIKSKNTELVLIGVGHTFDPEDNQVPIIEKEWKSFALLSGRKTAVVEGAVRGIAKTKEEAFEKEGGEGGYLAYLAGKSNINQVCYEPSNEELWNRGAEEFSKEHVLLSFMSDILYQFYNETNPPKKEEYAGFFIGQISSALKTEYKVEDIDVVAQKVIGKPILEAPKEIAYSLADPTNTENPLLEVQNFLTLYRDTVVIENIIKNHKEGISQFVLYGSSHVLMWGKVLISDMTFYE